MQIQCTHSTSQVLLGCLGFGRCCDMYVHSLETENISCIVKRLVHTIDSTWDERDYRTMAIMVCWGVPQPLFVFLSLYRIMATINDGLLRGPPAPEANPASTGWFVHQLLALAQEELASTGDRWGDIIYSTPSTGANLIILLTSI